MLRKLIFPGVLSLILAPGAAWSLGLGEIRLNSYLNQPMDAEIVLSVASPGELDSLRVALAPTAVFRERGLDRPGYFDDLRFRVQGTGPSSAVIRVSSTSPIVEPFLTFLLEARWSGGRMLREYTVLLDPPVFMPGPEIEQAPAAARQPAVDAPRPAPAPVSRPAAPPAAAAPAAAPAFEQESQYSVRRNDTLWAIAQQVRPDAALSTNQVMVALFRENPHAFDGNINRLRAGTILRVPSSQQMAATTSGEATAEVRRQTEAWRAAAPAPVDRRLELAPPTETARAPAPETAPVREPAAPAPELLDAVQELRSELAETRRLMEVKDAEIAALQERLAELESAPAPAPPVDEPVGAEPEPAVPEPAPEAAAVAPPPPAPAPTLMDRVFAVLGSLWLWLVLAVVLIAAAVGIFLSKRKEHERSIEQDLAETGTWGTLEDTDGKLAAATVGGAGGVAGRKFEARPARGENLDSILVEEADVPAARETPQAPEARVTPPAAKPAPGAAAAEEDYQYPFEDTIAGETGINLDQSDPMAEADFHMAYGLYDQAAEIIKKAVDREPDRYDLRRKLIDICFVWGNADEFLAQAQAIRGLEDDNAAADWAKIAIMGRQLCPSEPMFVTTETAGVDVDVGGEEPGTPEAGQAAPADEWLDFDVGESDESLQALGDTREQPAPGMDSDSPEHTAELNLEELGIDLDLGESGEHALQDLADRAPEFFDEPEEEPPHEPTQRISGSAGEAAEETRAEEATGESDDVSGTQMMDASKIRSGEGPTQRGEGWELAEDEPTMSGADGFEEEDGDDRGSETQIFEGAGGDDAATMTNVGGFGEEDEEGSDRTFIKKFEPSQEAPTVEVGGFDDEDDADLGLDELTEALKADIDQPDEEDVIESTQMTPSLRPEEVSEHELGDTAEMAAAEMDEIGTKLDLARAYIDMGDPEGARSILGEVVEEGDEAQRDEARQLLASLD
jgi:pilus assembly protein FimV